MEENDLYESRFYALNSKLSALFKAAVQSGKFSEFKDGARICLGTMNENDMKNIMELIIRQVLMEYLEKKAGIEILENVFQFSINTALSDLCPGNLPVLVLGDMFDGSTLSECETIFAFIESRAEIFKKDIFFRTCKNHLLRSCNDLLRRLSRSQNTVFCGRILLFLARIFPLSERSGLNIISEFNLENKTVFSSKDDSFSDGLDQEEAMDDGEAASRKYSMDYNLYRKFWLLQDFFRNPNSCYNKVHWRHFTNYATDVLTVFGSFKSDDTTSVQWEQALSSSLLLNQGTFAFFAKYLTSPKLLKLELRDSNFRRCVLLQFLMLFQYLSSQVKFKLDSFVLAEEQSNWVKEATAKVYKLLEDTPPDGVVFCQTVVKILKREEYWNAWKNEGCPDFKTVEDKSDQHATKPKLRLADIMDQPDKVFVGNNELNKLWNICPDNWEACRTKQRKFVPSMEKFFENAIYQADPANQVELKSKDVSDPRFLWKSLRLLATKSPYFFSVNNTQPKKTADYIESVIQKIPKEKSLALDLAHEESEPMAEEPFEDGNDETLQTSGDESPDKEGTTEAFPSPPTPNYS